MKIIWLPKSELQITLYMFRTLWIEIEIQQKYQTYLNHLGFSTSELDSIRWSEAAYDVSPSSSFDQLDSSTAVPLQLDDHNHDAAPVASEEVASPSPESLR